MQSTNPANEMLYDFNPLLAGSAFL